MCGIYGIWDRARASTAEALGAELAPMGRALAHRGPDGEGTFLDATVGLALGHRRLAILDLTAAAAQPLASATGRHVLVFNGEIYNFRELRARLATDDPAWRPRGTGDTEVLLAACARWGVATAIERAAGMFAFALWDAVAHTLTLVRDRFGKKPLYWAQAGEVVLFGSELSALAAHPRCPRGIDRDALAGYLQYGYVAAPRSIRAGVAKLPPGHTLEIPADGPPRLVRWWDAAAVAREASARAPATDEELEAALSLACRERLESDVPLGCLLSGGIDSSLVAALAGRAATTPLRTFTIGFGEPAFDESAHAARVAHALGTKHTAIRLDPARALELAQTLPAATDEPLADPSLLPTALVFAEARKHVTVALSGDGGDELFGGYGRYALARRMIAVGRVVPAALRRTLAWTLGGVPATLLGAVAGAGARDRALKGLDVLARRTPAAVYDRLVSHWDDPTILVPGATPVGPPEVDLAAWARPVRAMRQADIGGYLPGDILAKVDRASMAHGLEARAPLLDHRVYALAMTLSDSALVAGGVAKAPLRRLLARHLAPSELARPKQGFGIPLAAWLRGPLADWASALLTQGRLEAAGLAAAPVLARWQEHVRGTRSWHYPLWGVLSYVAWLEQHSA